MNSEINNRIAELAVVKALKGYTWNDIADQINIEYGTNLSWDACRKRAAHTVLEMQVSEETALSEQNSESYNISDFRSPEDEQIQTLKDECIQTRAIFRRFDREESIKQMAKDTAKIIASSKPLVDFQTRSIVETQNEALLIISDWHYGIVIDNYMNTYNTDICRKRVAELTNSAIEKVKENNIQTLHVLNLGDMIAGIIHLQLRINSRIDVLTQVMEVSEIIAEMLHTLAKHVNVEYYQVLDNHSRIDPNKKEALQLESLARITFWFLKERFKDSTQITINSNEIDDDIALFYINDEYLVVGVHGDKDKQSNIISKLNLFIKEPIDLVCSAHLHHANFDEDNNTLRISNGSLMGTDEYAFQKRLNSQPSQTFVTFKSTPKGIDVDGVFKLNSYIYS